MKKILVTFTLLLSLGCGKMHLPRLPDGSIDTKTLLVWTEAGIQADCAIQGASAHVCKVGLPAVKALETKDSRDVRAALVALSLDDPDLAPYLHWAINALPV